MMMKRIWCSLTNERRIEDERCLWKGAAHDPDRIALGRAEVAQSLDRIPMMLLGGDDEHVSLGGRQVQKRLTLRHRDRQLVCKRRLADLHERHEDGQCPVRQHPVPAPGDGLLDGPEQIANVSGLECRSHWFLFPA